MPEVNLQKDESKQVSIEALVKLHEQAWENFHERRRHEYRVCIAVWTLYALAIAQIIASSISFNLKTKLMFSIFVTILMFLHIQWIHGLAAANLMDRKFAFFYGRKLRELGNIKLPSGITNDNKFMKEDKKFSFRTTVFNWNHRTEIGVTIILTLAVVELLLIM